MAAPNLKSPTTITGKTARSKITGTSIVGVVTNAGSSGKVLKINSIFAANIDGTSGVNVSVSVYDGSTDYYIASTIYVPPDATQIISTIEVEFQDQIFLVWMIQMPIPGFQEEYIIPPIISCCQGKKMDLILVVYLLDGNLI